jgi:hypothetical protein
MAPRIIQFASSLLAKETNRYNIVVPVVVLAAVVVVFAVVPMTNQQQCGLQTFPSGETFDFKTLSARESLPTFSPPGKVSFRRQFINKLSCN